MNWFVTLVLLAICAGCLAAAYYILVGSYL
jgi:hypothetical protein